MKLTDIYWIAALLEGEGNFRYGTTSPSISIQMSDLDIIERFRRVTKTEKVKITVIPRENAKTMYSTSIYGNLAIQWMMTIYLIMGIRRQGKIRNVLAKWKDDNFTKEQSRKHNKTWDHTGYMKEYNKSRKIRDIIKSIMISRGVSKKEAIEIAKKFNLLETVQ